eukprot:TRINITY_DN830_c0_g1_i2.p1 TRINITY_DN830_c0_g1~~TRINITY_DN830_c0_g1_i2.p1  ORF type:complete len:289 (+),score=44.64 TRINITY_DN830_c0_g1_i2:380-1246(+)
MVNSLLGTNLSLSIPFPVSNESFVTTTSSNVISGAPCFLPSKCTVTSLMIVFIGSSSHPHPHPPKPLPPPTPLMSNKDFTPPFVMSLDQGTSSSRAIIFDSNAKLVTFSQKEFKQITPQPGWCEHNPVEVISSMRDCMRGAVTNAELAFGIDPDDIKAIGVTNHRESICVWDKETGKPLYNIIVWLDTRTKDIVHRLTEEHDGNVDALRAKCGLPFSTYFSAMKLLWVMENVPAVQEAIANDTAMFGTIDTWLIWNLTGGKANGVHVTDVTNASRIHLSPFPPPSLPF